jgi:hypothetical protein
MIGTLERPWAVGADNMAIPDYQSLMRPLLAFVADGAEKSVKGATDSLAKEPKAFR